MLRRWILYTCFLLPVLGWTEEASRERSEKDELEQEIKELKDQLNKGRLKEMDEQVKGEGLMISDWEKYSQVLEKVRQQHEDDREIKEKIESLEERKVKLQNKEKSKE